jgi:hypothetical protein
MSYIQNPSPQKPQPKPLVLLLNFLIPVVATALVTAGVNALIGANKS